MKVRAARATDLYLLDGLGDPADTRYVREVTRFLATGAWLRQQDRPDSHLVVFEVDGEIVGAASFERAAPHVWYLAAICLFPEYRNQGLGAVAISAICDLLEDLDPDAESLFWKRHLDNEPMRTAGARLGATELRADDEYVTVAVPLD